MNKNQNNINNDTAVLESMFTTFYPVLASFCLKYIQDKEVVRDIIQDIFLSVWEHRQEIDFSIPLHSYLLRLAHHRCVNYLRKLETERSYLDRTSPELMQMELQYDDIFEQLVAKTMQEKIETTVKKMPEQCRKIFYMSRYRGMSHHDIAQELHISVRTVESQIYKVLKSLKTVIFP